MSIVYMRKSTRKGKKYMVTIIHKNNKRCTVHFGANGMSDYTKHKDKDRMKRYEARHRSRENWTKSGICTAGFWAKWILWSKPGIKLASDYTSKKFDIIIRRSNPPK